MRTFLSLLVAGLLACGAPLAVAEEGSTGNWGDDDEEKKGSEGEKKEDPFAVPKTGGEGTPETPAPEVVQPGGYPIAEIDRPLVLPPMTTEIQGSFDFDFIAHVDNRFALRLGAGLGVAEKIEAGLFFPLQFSPDFRAGDFDLYGKYDLSDMVGVDNLRIAGRLNVILPLSDGASRWRPSDFVIVADAPIKFKFHDMFAVLAGLGMGFTAGDASEFLFSLDLGFLVQPTEVLAFEFHFGVRAFAGDYDTTLVPLGFRGQYTLMGDLDLFAELGFPDLNDQGADHFQMILGASYRMGL